MSCVWVISGAGSGVGKTTVALKLRDALPKSVYAKLGHKERATGKPENYFRDLRELDSFVREARKKYRHIVVESNKCVSTISYRLTS